MIVALALVILEVLTVNLVFVMVAGGALVAGIAALLGAAVAIQFGLFAAVSLLLVAVVRPVALRHLRVPSSVRTGVDALTGSDALVTEAVTAGDGRVKIGGEVWSARAFDSSKTYAVGELVQVIEISGATALVG